VAKWRENDHDEGKDTYSDGVRRRVARKLVRIPYYSVYAVSVAKWHRSDGCWVFDNCQITEARQSKVESSTVLLGSTVCLVLTWGPGWEQARVEQSVSTTS
jgi:hypothetical protein